MPEYNSESVALQYRPIFDLSGGMVTNYNFTRIKPNQCLLLLNADLYKDGTAQTRKGRTKLNSTALSGNPTVTSLSTLGQSSGADLIFAGAGGVLSEVSTGTANTIRSGLDANGYLAGVNFNDWRFFCNGVDAPFMTQGTSGTTYQTGITPVSSIQFAGFSVAATAGGSATDGNHRVTMRYRSTITGAQSNPYISGTTVQFVSVTMGAGSNTYSITIGAAAVSSDAQVDQIDYFAQEAGAGVDSPYFYLGSSANAAAVYTFGTNVSDNELMVLERLDVDNDLPSVSMRDLEMYRGRLFGIIDDYHVGFSKQRSDANSFVNLPTSWPPANELAVGNGDGDPLRKIMVFADYVFAFKRNSIWILVGDINSDSFGFRRLKTNYTNVGLLNQKSVTQAGDKIFFVTDDLKFFYFRMTDFDTQQLRLPDIPPSDSVSDVFVTFASPYRQFVNVVNNTFGQYNQIWISFSNGTSGLSASNNYNTFVFDYSQVDESDTWNGGSWGIHTSIEAASSVLARDSDKNYLLYTGDYYGFIWKHDGVDGDGAEINSTSTGGNTSTSLNDTGESFSSDIIGTFILIRSGTGEGQVRRITAVPTSTSLTVDPAWDITPDNTSDYSIGFIDFQIWSRFDWCNDEAPPNFDKYAWYVDFDFETDADGYGFEVQILKDRQGAVTEEALDVVVTFEGALWGSGIWGTSVWADTQKNQGQVGLDLYFKQISHRIINNLAGQPVKINGWTYTFQTVDMMRSG